MRGDTVRVLLGVMVGYVGGFLVSAIAGLSHFDKSIWLLPTGCASHVETWTLAENKTISSAHATGPQQVGGDQVTKVQSYDLIYHPLTLFGHYYFLPDYAMDRLAVRSFLGGSYFEQRTHSNVEALLSRYPGNMVHAGTFFGDMVPHFSTIIGSSGVLYAFEPNTKNYLLAQMTVEQNKLSNVVLVNAALGRNVTQQQIMTADSKGHDMGGGSTVSRRGKTRVPQMTVDMFGITNISLIELDVEGFEQEALIGALQTIKREKPIVAMEDISKGGGSFLKKLGYEMACESSGLDYWTSPDKLSEVKAIVCH